MPNNTPAHRRAGLDFAQELALLATRAPDPTAKKAAFAAVNWLRRHYGRNDEEKQADIVDAITIGCTTYDDLVAETQMNRPDIIRLVKLLETAGRVQIKRLALGDRRGNPPVFLTLTD